MTELAADVSTDGEWLWRILNLLTCGDTVFA